MPREEHQDLHRKMGEPLRGPLSLGPCPLLNEASARQAQRAPWRGH
jgi:hypothetical protein